MKKLTETRICGYCGKEYHPNYGRPNQSFCSRSCYLKNRWGEKQPVNICPTCGRPATSRGYRKQVYCSWECAQIGKNGRPNPGRSNKITKTCAWCGKDVERPKSNFHSNLVFCDYSCMAQWQSINKRKGNHPRWAGGTRNARGCGWKAAREEARRLSKGRCKMCGIKANTVHHKIPVRCFKSPSDAHSQSNLIVLCPSCHPKMEKIFRETMPLLNLIQWKNQNNSV